MIRESISTIILIFSSKSLLLDYFNYQLNDLFQQFFDIIVMKAEKNRKQQLSQLIRKSYNFGFGYLAIDNENLSDDDITMFIEEIGVSGNLYYLRIQGNKNITSQSVKKLVQCYQKIDILYLSLCQIQEQTLCDINTLEILNDFRIFGSGDRELRFTSIGGLQWNALQKLTLDNVKLSSFACKQLTRTSMPSLNTLDLPKNNIPSYMLIHLSKSQWQKLKAVSFIKNRITRQGLHILRKCNWRFLSYISVDRNPGLSDLTQLDFQPKSFAAECKIAAFFKVKKKLEKDQLNGLFD